MIPVPRKAYERSLNQLRPMLKTVEHFRGEYLVTHAHKEGDWKVFINHTRCFDVAIALLKDGRGYVGFAKRNHKDTPNRRRGYEIAVGRALKAALTEHTPDVVMAKDLEGRELGDWCRQWLKESGWCVW